MGYCFVCVTVREMPMKLVEKAADSQGPSHKSNDRVTLWGVGKSQVLAGKGYGAVRKDIFTVCSCCVQENRTLYICASKRYLIHHQFPFLTANLQCPAVCLTAQVKKG